MSYSVVPTFVTGDLFTAANANTYWRDNFAAGVPGIFSAAGDLAYSTAANASASLPIGTYGQKLRVNSAGTAPEWADDFSGCSLSTTDQDLDVTYEKINFTAEDYDTDDYWSDTDSDKIIIPITGIYQLSGTVTFDAMTSTDFTYINHFVRMGGSVYLAYERSDPSSERTLSFCYINKFNAGYNPYLEVYRGGGSTDWTTDSGVSNVSYQITWLGTT